VIAEIFQKQVAEKQKEFGFTMPGFEFLEKVCRLLKEKASFVNEFWNLGKYFFMAPESFDKEIISKKWNEKTAGFFSTVKEKFLAQNNFAHDELEKVFKQTATDLGIKPGEVMQLFRVIITGGAGGPALFEVVALLGKEEVNKRIERALKEF
jgi:glutamyl-tRNA synthetase